MGQIRPQPRVKLIVGFIFKEDAILQKSEAILKKYFGKTDFESPILSFTHTDYYESEFGTGLKRKFISFEKLVPADNIFRVKIISNKIEAKFLKKSKRLINIDPGYVDMAKLILMSTKDYCHRIYVGKGIYAETTLTYKGKSFTHLEWTYRDYKTCDYIAFFNQVRQIYAGQINR